MKIVPLKEEHLRSIKVRPFEVEDYGQNIDDEQIEYFLSSTHAYTLLDDDGEVIAIMGGLVERSLCHAWMLGSELIYKYPVATLKLIFRIHNDGIKKFGVKKFFTYNLPGHEREMNYLKSIGYKEHGRANDFDDNKERILFIREVA